MSKLATLAFVVAILVSGLALPSAAAPALPLQAISWKINLNGNTPTSGVTNSGVLLLQAGPKNDHTDYPYAVADGNPFPSDDFDMVFSFAYRQLEWNGAGLVVLAQDGTGMFWVWADANHGIETGINGLPWSTDWDHPAQGGSSSPFFKVSNGASANTFTFQMRGQTVHLLVDGVERLTWTTSLRPETMFAGHPAIGQQAGLLPDGRPPVAGFVDGNGIVTQRWWAAKVQPLWTALALTGVEISSLGGANLLTCAVEVNCCTSDMESTGIATGLQRARTKTASGTEFAVRASGHVCLGQSGENVNVRGQLAALGNVLVQLDGGTQVELRATDTASNIAVTVGVSNDVAGLRDLPTSLPATAEKLPRAPNGQAYALVKAVQVQADEGAALDSVQMGLDASVSANSRLVMWDGSNWVDPSEYIGRNAGQGNVKVFAAQNDGTRATCVFDRPGTCALLVPLQSVKSSPAPALLSLLLLAVLAVTQRSRLE